MINNRKQKILIFSTAYYPFVGGAEVAVKEITSRLSDDFEFDSGFSGDVFLTTPSRISPVFLAICVSCGAANATPAVITTSMLKSKKLRKRESFIINRSGVGQLILFVTGKNSNRYYVRQFPFVSTFLIRPGLRRDECGL